MRKAMPVRRREELLRALDVAGDVGVLDGSAHDQVDVALQQSAKLVEQPEVGLDARVGLHGLELDQEVEIALPGPEVPSQR